jgi:hypothetical protein
MYYLYKILDFLGAIFLSLVFLALVLFWYIGIPYLAFKFIGGVSYTAYLSLWLGMHLLRNIFGRIKAQKQIKILEDFFENMED